jgi:hypothetical protein
VSLGRERVRHPLHARRLDDRRAVRGAALMMKNRREGPDSWRCAWCGCSWAEACNTAERERRSLMPNATTCSPRCGRNHRYRARSGRRPPAWRCSECGCARTTAERRRRERGLRPLTSVAVVCSPECGRARYSRLGAALPPVPPAPPGPWRCDACGCDRETAVKRRLAAGLTRLRGTARVCTPECAVTRKVRLSVKDTPGR